jgi:hypothetical protein
MQRAMFLVVVGLLACGDTPEAKKAREEAKRAVDAAERAVDAAGDAAARAGKDGLERSKELAHDGYEKSKELARDGAELAKQGVDKVKDAATPDASKTVETRVTETKTPDGETVKTVETKEVVKPR